MASACERLDMPPSVSVPDRLRWPTAVALLVAAAAHVPVIPEHLHEAPYMGWLFVLFTAVATAAAIIVVIRTAAPAVVIGAGLISAFAILAYCLTRVVALPQLADDVGNWTEPLGLVSIASEAAVVALSVAATFRRRKQSNRAFVTNTM